MSTAIILGQKSTLALYGIGFDTDILAGQVAPSSIAMYKRDFAAYLAYARETGNLAADATTLALWRTHLAGSTTYSPNTINRMLSAVKRVVKEAAQQGYTSHENADAFAHVQGVKTKAMKSRVKKTSRTRIEPADMRRLCEAPNVDTLTGLRDRALLATLASSGCRISEIVTLTATQIHRKGRGYILTVMGKNQEEDREAPLSVEAYNAINTWIGARGSVYSQYIFTSMQGRSQQPTAEPLSSVGAWKAVQKYADAVGLNHVKPHDFRRFVGTQLASKDIRKAQKALGHKRIDTTARHYVLDELEPGLTDGLY